MAVVWFDGLESDLNVKELSDKSIHGIKVFNDKANFGNLLVGSEVLVKCIMDIRRHLAASFTEHFSSKTRNDKIFYKRMGSRCLEMLNRALKEANERTTKILGCNLYTAYNGFFNYGETDAINIFKLYHMIPTFFTTHETGFNIAGLFMCSDLFTITLEVNENEKCGYKYSYIEKFHKAGFHIKPTVIKDAICANDYDYFVDLFSSNSLISETKAPIEGILLNYMKCRHEHELMQSKNGLLHQTIKAKKATLGSWSDVGNEDILLSVDELIEVFAHDNLSDECMTPTPEYSNFPPLVKSPLYTSVLKTTAKTQPTALVKPTSHSEFDALISLLEECNYIKQKNNITISFVYDGITQMKENISVFRDFEKSKRKIDTIFDVIVLLTFGERIVVLTELFECQEIWSDKIGQTIHKKIANARFTPQWDLYAKIGKMCCEKRNSLISLLKLKTGSGATNLDIAGCTLSLVNKISTVCRMLYNCTGYKVSVERPVARHAEMQNLCNIFDYHNWLFSKNLLGSLNSVQSSILTCGKGYSIGKGCDSLAKVMITVSGKQANCIIGNDRAIREVNLMTSRKKTTTRKPSKIYHQPVVNGITTTNKYDTLSVDDCSSTSSRDDIETTPFCRRITNPKKKSYLNTMTALKEANINGKSVWHNILKSSGSDAKST